MSPQAPKGMSMTRVDGHHPGHARDRRLAELERTRTELLALQTRLETLDPAGCHDDICVAIPNPATAMQPGP